MLGRLREWIVELELLGCRALMRWDESRGYSRCHVLARWDESRCWLGPFPFVPTCVECVLLVSDTRWLAASADG